MSDEKLACLGKCALWHDSSLNDCKKQGCPNVVVIKEYIWKPFSTAPKDGIEFLVRYPYQNNTKQLIHWNLIFERWQSKDKPVLGLENQDCEWCKIPE